ncbi:hypothetical protein EV702DRAFT_1204714 [Suillus placidus]|uniref:Uncharacterized protein n=1 Tax=Suillus placidus TaxID=48579 RepID=A0A9P7CWX3_9AGAM|nr:hypothetical protein EV702DRAFT_1204714 [Suillus placidus]
MILEAGIIDSDYMMILSYIITPRHPLPHPFSQPSVIPQLQPAAPIVPVPSSSKQLLETDEDQPTISIKKPRTDLDVDFEQDFNIYDKGPRDEQEQELGYEERGEESLRHEELNDHPDTINPTINLDDAHYLHNSHDDFVRGEERDDHPNTVNANIDCDDDHPHNADVADDEGPPHDNDPLIQAMGWTDEDLEELHRMAQLEDAQDAMSFITALCKASLDDPHSCLPEEVLARLHNPPHQLPDSTDPDLILLLKDYFANLTVNAYNLVRDATMEHHPEDDIYSHYCIKHAVMELSGVVPIVHDMCPNTCLAFTGPYADLDHCPQCGEGRWDPKKTTATQKVACQTFDTFPIGLQLQALWRHPDHAEKM